MSHSRSLMGFDRAGLILLLLLLLLLLLSARGRGSENETQQEQEQEGSPIPDLLTIERDGKCEE
jgi:hypothetical protein